jgi:type IV secretion system T-DNA border endonuclease VirD2
VLAAVKNFAGEEFGLQYRYAMVLHTDEPHPHVHMVVKAMNERGERLNIRKPMLRQWRREFARHLRSLGVPANATERVVRGQALSSKRDGIYRAAKRGESRVLRQKAEAVVAELARGGLRMESGKAKVINTREAVRRGWAAIEERLLNEGRPELSWLVKKFANQVGSPHTEKEQIAAGLMRRT